MILFQKEVSKISILFSIIEPNQATESIQDSINGLVKARKSTCGYQHRIGYTRTNYSEPTAFPEVTQKNKVPPDSLKQPIHLFSITRFVQAGIINAQWSISRNDS